MEDLHTPNDPTFGVWTFAYDENGNLISQTDPKNQRIEYSYDEFDRVLMEDDTGNAGVEITYIYDQGLNGIGRLTAVDMPYLELTEKRKGFY